MDKHHHSTTVPAKTCPACGNPITQQTSRGHRRRKYCNDLCRSYVSYRKTHPYARPEREGKPERWKRPELPFLTLTWQRCINAWVQASYERSHSEQTRRAYERTIYALLDRFQKSPEDITQDDILQWIHEPSQSRRNRGAKLAPGSSKNRLDILKSFFNFASSFTVSGKDGRPERALTTINPTSGLHAGHAAISYKAFSLDDLDRLFAAIPTDTVRGLRARAVFSVFFWTCRRRMEIQRLRWKDLEQATIIGKDGSRRIATVYTFRGKGHSLSDDRAELPEPAAAALNKYLVASGRMSTIQPEDPLFTRLLIRTDLDRHQPLSDESMWNELKYWTQQAGMDPRSVSIHSFRHGGARARYEAGSDIREIQQILRHKSLQVTDVYLRTLVSVEDHGAQLLEKQWSRFS